MTLLRVLARAAALVPVVAGGAWVALASWLPEPAAERRALGEVTQRFEFAEWNRFVDEPAHALPRLIDLSLLHVSGSSVQLIAIANWLVAAGVAIALASLLRRVFVLGMPGHLLALATGGLFACSPAFGADWLHGERVGVFLPPLLLLVALALLHGDGRFVWRALGAVSIAALAPFAHGGGMFVGVALMPSLADAAVRAGKGRAGWIAAALFAGVGAAVVSMLPAGRVALDANGLFEHAVAAPVATLLWFAEATGSTWLDPLPATNLDEVVLGTASWLAPLLLWRFGDRSDAARRAAAPMYGCVWFGLLLMAWLAVRNGPDVPPQVRRELAYGAFLLPVGLAGLFAARLAMGFVAVAGGAALLLGLQDWHRGIEPLRLAVAKVQVLEAAVLLPDVHPGSRPDAVLPLAPSTMAVLEQRHWVPLPVESRLQAQAVHDVVQAKNLGSCVGGDTRSLRGTARSSLFGGVVRCVLALVEPPAAPAKFAGRTQPAYAGAGRDVEWRIEFDEALAEGTRVRAIGLRGRAPETFTLGPWYVVRDGKLAAMP